ncbi:MAG: pilus assembly PilX family protein [Oceanococcus sp.]
MMPRRPLKKQSGAALIVGLIVLVAVTVVAISGIKSTNIQQSMATNMQERITVFQGAESMVRQLVNLANTIEDQIDTDGDGVDDQQILVAAINFALAEPPLPPIPLLLDTPNGLMNGDAQFSYVGQSNAPGYSMGVGTAGVFVGHNYLVNAVARMPAANARANNLQGLMRVAPAP